MGIRCECPNGHQLHVKAYLAGQRGICPKCGARVQVPDVAPDQGAARQVTESTAISVAAESVSAVLKHSSETRRGAGSGPRRATLAKREPGKTSPPATDDDANSDSIEIETDSKGASVKTNSPVASTSATPTASSRTPPTATPTAGPAFPPSATPTDAAPGVWYIRPPAGGQYGPADEATFTRWIRENRIVADSYVWCEGWTDWQRAGDVAQQLPVPLRQSTTKQATSAGSDMATGAAESGGATRESATVRSLRQARRRSQRLQMIVAALLLVLVFVLLGVLIWVLVREPVPESHPGGVVYAESINFDSVRDLSVSNS